MILLITTVTYRKNKILTLFYVKIFHIKLKGTLVLGKLFVFFLPRNVYQLGRIVES